MPVRNWSNSSGGTWNVASNWDTGVVPGQGANVDDASITAAGTYVVDLTDTENPTNVTLDSAHATLLIDSLGQLFPSGTFALNAGTLDLKGRLAFATVNANGGTLIDDGGTLDGVTWVGPLVFGTGNGSLHIKDGINLQNTGGSIPGQLTFTTVGNITFDDSDSFDNAVLTFGATNGPSYLNANQTFTIGHTTTIQQTAASTQSGILGTDALNHGTIDLAASSGGFFSNLTTFDNASDGSFTVAAGEGALFNIQLFKNEGSISVLTNGHLTVESTATNAGQISVANGSTITFDGSLQGAGAIGLTLFGVAEVVADSGTVNFNDNRLDTLRLVQPNQFLGTIGGFRGANVIDLYRTAATTANYAYAAGDGTLTVLNGTTTVATLNLGGFDYSADTFTVGTDGNGGNQITTSEKNACFVTGTRIGVEGGARAVEDLAVGDRVVTADGATRPVVWIGHRRVDCARHPRPESVWPIRIEAGAFGPSQPARPLLVSPDHALFVDGALIPARYLVDGEQVRAVPVDAVTYWHVELDAHDVLLAEGMPAESFLDSGNRDAFDDAPVVALHPDFSARAWEAEGCAPLVVTGPVLERARRRLTDRATLRFVAAA